MSGNFAGLAYLVASICFILALRGLSSPETARRFAAGLWGRKTGAGAEFGYPVGVFLHADGKLAVLTVRTVSDEFYVVVSAHGQQIAVFTAEDPYPPTGPPAVEDTDVGQRASLCSAGP